MPRKLAIYTDGASRGNPGEAAIGVVLKDDQGAVLDTLSEYIGVATNNIAEYMALIRALETAPRFAPTEIAVYMDSQLVVRQIVGQYRVKSGHLLALVERARCLCRLLPVVQFHHIPRAQNTEADALANAALDKRGRVGNNGRAELHR